MWRIFKRKIRNPIASSQAMWCSEFALRINANEEIFEWNGLDPEVTHCQHLYDLIVRYQDLPQTSFVQLK